MEYNDINKIGKVTDYDKYFGVGEIASINDIYMFTINDIKEEIYKGDLVRFRGEEVNDGVKRAFFVKKVELTDDMKDVYIKGKKPE